MRTMILIAAGFLTLATACSLTVTETPTPRPTYTPYPTYTPVPFPQLGTTSALPTPTISPDMFREVGQEQLFFGDTWLEFEKAGQALGEGKYQDALEGYLETQRLHGEPSGILQNWIGNSYLN